MLTFYYKAREPSGKSVSGTVQAKSQPEAMQQLQREGKTVTEIRVGAAPVDAGEVQTRNAARQVKREEVIAFSSQLAVMIETGVTLTEALDAFNEQSKSGNLKRVISVVSDRIKAGMSFSSAMREFPSVFPKLMISLMEASEASGTMGMMLRRISEYLSKERRTAKQIKGALTYPAVMVTLAFTVTIFLVIWVLPRFARIYESREAGLPALTKFVLGLSKFLTTHWLALLIGLGVVFGIGLAIRFSKWGPAIIDTIKLKAPVVGPMYTQFYLTRATRTLGTLLAAGVPLLDAVRIVKGVTSNYYWEQLWKETETAMTTGRTITEVMVDSPLIPPSIGQMISAGERSGKLPEVLEKISESTENDLDEAIKTGTQLIEPAMIVFMGLTIGGIAIALLLPIFSVANVMSGQ